MPDATCSINGCTLPVARPTRGWCEAHYTRWRRHGDPLAGGPDHILGNDAARFWQKVDKTETCWLWTAAIATGYGRFYLDGHLVPAHRFAYELLVGPIPAGLDLDHLCRVRNCVNPAHLEPVTRQENLARTPTANIAKTHCPQGHPYDESNTYVAATGRQCLTCRTETSRRRARRRTKE